MQHSGKAVFAALLLTGVATLSETRPAHAQAAVLCVNCSELPTQLLQYAKEAASLVEQIEMYQNMLQNTQALGSFAFNNAVGDILGIRADMNAGMMLANNAATFTGQLGNIPAFAPQLSNLSLVQTQYQTWGTVTQNDVNQLQSSLGLQETQRQSDAQTLTQLQAHASGAIGQMQAIQAGDEIAALGVSQMQKLQELLAQETQLVVDQTTVNKDENALGHSAEEQFFNAPLPGLSGNGHGYQ